MITFGSICSGIESASVAWEPLGFTAQWLSEIEPFPCAVLAHHYPHTPNLGDMTQLPAMVRSGMVPAPDVLVGGTPCQAFSVAGMRKGLADERGNLTMVFADLADAIDEQRPEGQETVVVWENVPGVLSDKDNAFGCYLAALAGSGQTVEPGPRPPVGKNSGNWRWDKKRRIHIPRWANAGAVSGPKRRVAWRILDAQYFGVAQRRRRVFVVASARKGFDPRTVLFESEGVRRDTPPSRETGQDAAAGPAHSLRGEGFDASEDGTGRGTPLVPVWPAQVAATLDAAFAAKHGQNDQHALGGASWFVPVAYGGNNTSGPIDVATACNAKSTQRNDFEPETFIVRPVNTQIATRGGALGRNTGFGIGEPNEPGFTLQSAHSHGVAIGGTAVRRLTPTECERLQGFPDGYTQIPYRNKAADKCPDGPRYKALGNSKAVPVVRWIGARLKRQLCGECNGVGRVCCGGKHGYFECCSNTVTCGNCG